MKERIERQYGRPHFSVRIDRRNPDHHLWNNNGTWWFHATVHGRAYRKERVRVSLKTKDRSEARRRRDRVLRSAGLAGEAEGA